MFKYIMVSYAMGNSDIKIWHNGTNKQAGNPLGVLIVNT